jgi:FtsP/CotA-like multicopper oxidase with cupredoxin domain
VWPSDPVTLRTFDPSRTDVCVHAGHREIWRLVNLSNETHNFHIHQSKFRVLTVYDPYNQLRHETPWALAPDQVHDVFPVPKFGYVDIEIGFGTGSRQDVVGGLSYGPTQVPDGVPRPVQVGRFVFHCHILEHEGGGMMAVIEVLPRPIQTAVGERR